MAQKKLHSEVKRQAKAAPKKAGKPVSLDESLKRMHKRHGKLLKKLAE